MPILRATEPLQTPILPTPRRVTARPDVVVSASFNKFLAEARETITELSDEGCRVLSPQGPMAWREPERGFLLLEGDRRFRDLSVKATEDRHLAAIACSDFLFLVCPEGYVGPATAMEIGAAIGCDVPVYSLTQPADPKIAVFITVVARVRDAVLNHRVAIL